MAEISDAEKVEIIRQILAEPVPKWFQNSHRRANCYAEQLERIAAVVDSAQTNDESGGDSGRCSAHLATGR
jgi:hypothetical protein